MKLIPLSTKAVDFKTERALSFIESQNSKFHSAGIVVEIVSVPSY